MKRYPLMTYAVLAGLLSLWGCKDGNLFGSFRKEGSGDTATKLADARAALSRKEFNNARAYYESILASDPRNSQALYGAASATMGASGLDLGTLLSNIITTKGAPSAVPIHSLGDAIQSATLGAGSSSSADSLLNGLNLTALKNNINVIICYLSRIRVGNSDGVIPADDVSTLLSLMITRTLRAVLRAQDDGFIDIRKVGSSYQVVVTGSPSDLDTYCGNGEIEKSLDDIAGAVDSLRAVVHKLNPTSGSTLSEIEADVDDAFAQFKQKVKDHDTAAACDPVMNKFQSVSDIPSPYPATDDCSNTGACCH